jgi:ubiquinone/menaquinone biosynthesis C-methylase UbiE
MFLDPKKNIIQLGLHEGMRIADFGAGSGHVARIVSTLVGHTGHVYVVEIQKGLVKKLEDDLKADKITNVSCIWGDIEKNGGTKIADESMDAVIVSNVLFQVTDKFGLIDEAKRILKKDGKILVIDWQESSSGIGPVSNKVVDKTSAIDLFHRRGLKLFSSISTEPHQYGIIFTHE